MLVYSAWQVGHTAQSSSRNEIGLPQKSQKSPSSSSSKLLIRESLRRGIAWYAIEMLPLEPHKVPAL